MIHAYNHTYPCLFCRGAGSCQECASSGQRGHTIVQERSAGIIATFSGPAATLPAAGKALEEAVGHATGVLA